METTEIEQDLSAWYDIADTDDLRKFQEKLIQELQHPSGKDKKHSLVSHNFAIPEHPDFMLHVVCDFDAISDIDNSRVVSYRSLAVVDYRHPVEALAINFTHIFTDKSCYSRDIDTCVGNAIGFVKTDLRSACLHLGMDMYGSKYWFFDEVHEMWAEETKKMLTGEN